MGPARRPGRKATWLAAAGGALLLLGGCNSLPDSGPTESRVNQDQRDPKKNTVGYGIVQISPDLITLLQSEAPPLFSSLAGDETPAYGKNDRIGPGDILQVSIYEVGSALFSPTSMSTGMGGSTGATGGGTGSMSGTSTASHLPLLSVDGSGNIEIPFAGQIHVANMTTNQAADAILARLKQKSQAPQVLVRIASDIANSVMVYGGVRRPSRIMLTPNRERILDVIALAGGEEQQTHADEDYVVRLTRNSKIAELPLKVIENDPAQNIVMQPGDRVQLTFQPRSFSVFGATNHITQVQFTTPTLTMAEAVSRVGGPIDSRADPNAVYLFRFENADILRRLGMPVDNNASTAPVIYQLDMMNPSSYFLAQEFMMRDGDLIYVANSASNKFYKFFGLITTIISPGTSMGGIAR
ncbi:polysaccharide biosynthesis/export family protein [Komagataeibacter sp. FNDCF1]|uniref:polysaccharide biosynthesis/export family protein n=1 Tax=Komagataeibacter sp. FNDCF1 TaxID=2878681 RepID=UPI001E5CE1E7|nr:polysaccharide biosynthesis/export family protein [Komagataeibacter sp. FNDCF1]MCE2565391.1 polysaccharide export protein [Komagataeibacter sp. FNDCF1]